MPSRLVVGAGSTARAIIDAISDDPDELHVLTDDRQRAETLRENGVAVTVAEAIDRPALADLDADPETVVVATEASDRTVTAAEAVRALFPPEPALPS